MYDIRIQNCNEKLKSLLIELLPNQSSEMYLESGHPPRLILDGSFKVPESEILTHEIMDEFVCSFGKDASVNSRAFGKKNVTIVFNNDNIFRGAWDKVGGKYIMRFRRILPEGEKKPK